MFGRGDWEAVLDRRRGPHEIEGNGEQTLGTGEQTRDAKMGGWSDGRSNREGPRLRSDRAEVEKSDSPLEGPPVMLWGSSNEPQGLLMTDN